MAARFIFTSSLLVIFIVFMQFYKSYSNNFKYSCSSYVWTAMEDGNALDFSVSVVLVVIPNVSMFTLSPVLLWSRPPGMLPYRPGSQFAVSSVFVSVLLLLSGDIEVNPGPVNALNFEYINAWSAVGKTAIIHSVIDELRLDCLAITETWIRESHPDTIKLDPAPPGYVIHHTHRPGEGNGGGVAIVTRTELQSRPFSLSWSDPACDVVAIHLPTAAGRLNVIALYQAPRSAGFYDHLHNLLDEVNSLPGKTVICGDFNAPSPVTRGAVDQQLVDILTDYNCQQHVEEPTHRYGGLLDLIISPVEMQQIVNSVQVRDLGVSDHCVVSAVLNVNCVRSQNCITYSRRNYNWLDVDVFRRELLSCSASIQPKSTSNEFAVQLRDDVIVILDRLVPSKSVTKRRGKLTCGWLSKDAVKSRRARRRLERRYRRTRCEADRLAYRSVCRTTNKLINSSRREHISNCLGEASGNSRQRWRIANELLHRHEKHGASASDADYQKQCNTFSDFFVEKLRLIAKTIVDRLAVSDIIGLPTAVAMTPPVVMNNFDNVTVDEVIGVIKSIPLKMSPVDFVPTFLLKQCSDVFATLICRLANLSFSEGVFPDIFKVGQVTPLLKKPGAATNDPANYRPITNSNTIGKILERLAQRRIREHLSLSPNHGTFQSAYRALHSTETAMTRVVNDLLTAVDSGKPSVLLSLDISAAFDTIDHCRLLQRCSEVFGMSGQVCDWLRSYLTGRSSYVSLGQSRSATVDCTTGVPQGSVLGPLLFTIFTTPVLHLVYRITSMLTTLNCTRLLTQLLILTYRSCLNAQVPSQDGIWKMDYCSTRQKRKPW